MDVTCGRKGGVLAESPEAPAGWSLGCKVLLGSNLCKGKRRRARLSRGRSLRPQSLDQSAGSSGEKVVLEGNLSGKKARPFASFNDRKPSNTEGSDSWGPHSWASPSWQGSGQCTSVSATDHYEVLFWLGNWMDELSSVMMELLIGEASVEKKPRNSNSIFKLMSRIIGYPSQTCSCSVGANIG